MTRHVFNFHVPLVSIEDRELVETKVNIMQNWKPTHLNRYNNKDI